MEAAKTFATFRPLCLLIVALLSVACLSRAQTPSAWRFWGSNTGLNESYTVGVVMDAAGGVVAKHGDISGISRLTGYGVESMPDPGGVGRLSISDDDELWMFDGVRLRRHSGNTWISYEVPELKAWPRFAANTSQRWKLPSGSTEPLFDLTICPLGSGRVLILLPDRILEFDASLAITRTLKFAADTSLKRFIAMYRTKGRRIWVSGKSGVASISAVAGSGLRWQDYPAPSGIWDLEQPREGDNGEVFLAASVATGKVLVRFDGNAWKSIYKGRSKRLRAWRGADHDIWAEDSDRIFRLSGKHEELADRQEALSGTVLDVNPDSGGAFWISTTQGVARYSPRLWRTPAGVRDPEMDTLVNSITEDGSGNVWFLSDRFLICFDGEQWTHYTLPSGDRPSNTLTDAIRMLPGGKLAILSSTPGTVLVFDPLVKRFETIQHPERRRIRTFFPRRDGGFFIQTMSRENPASWRIETFDGRTFHTYLDLGITSDEADMRTLCETSDGDVWVGGTRTLGVVSKGVYRKIGPETGFHLPEAFYIYEPSPGHLLVGGRLEMVEFDGHKWTSIHQGFDRVRNMFRGQDGTLWVASGTGVYRYRNGSWIANTEGEGLPSSVVYRIFEDRKGRIWAGTTRGISLFHPESDPDPPKTSLLEDQNSREAAPDITVHIVFSGVDKWNLTPTGRLLYSYRLDGGGWGEFTPANSASFQQLKGGAHRFVVRAMDRNGNIDPSPASFDFTVLVPWYRHEGFLLLAVAGLVAIVMLFRSAWLQHKKVTFESSHDSLTRLPNRRAYEAALQASIGAAREEGSAVAVLLLDLDHFKPINDVLGHAGADRFLQEVASRLRSCGRSGDTLARIGGDEFAVILSRSTPASVAALATRLLELMRLPSRIGGQEVKTTASVGISSYPEHAPDVAGLLRLADLAMYHCKALTGDRYCVFEAPMNAADAGNARTVGLIQEALDHGHFRVHYQPILDPGGECFGFEALVRMEHPRAGRLAPLDFISAAEDSGLIVPMGQWVLGEACRQVSEWRSAGNANLRLSVNVSPIQLARPEWAATVIASLQRANLDPRALIVEITETAIMSRWNEAFAQLEQLRGLGIEVGLDDFGTGYSSLSALYQLPVDYVKIDKSFTQRIGTEIRGVALVNGIIQMAHQLGFRVVAEGVETAEQRACLLRNDCDLLQGYLLGRPLPAEEAGRLLLGNKSVCV